MRGQLYDGLSLFGPFVNRKNLNAAALHPGGAPSAAEDRTVLPHARMERRTHLGIARACAGLDRH